MSTTFSKYVLHILKIFENCCRRGLLAGASKELKTGIPKPQTDVRRLHMKTLPEGLYPFIDERLPLADLVMVEAPPDLEALLKAQAAASGVEIIRDEPVELRCRSAEYPDATFLVWWPHGTDRLHMLVPRRHAKGLA